MTLPTVVNLQKNNGTWLIVDSETVVSGNTSLPFQQVEPTSRNRTLLYLLGPAEFYLTSPEGTHAGFDPVSKKHVNEIKEISYIYNDISKSLAIPDLVGSWELKVIGTGEGKYTIGTQLINPQNPTTSTIEGTASPGSINTYLIHYPSEAGKPLELTEVK